MLDKKEMMRRIDRGLEIAKKYRILIENKDVIKLNPWFLNLLPIAGEFVKIKYKETGLEITGKDFLTTTISVAILMWISPEGIKEEDLINCTMAVFATAKAMVESLFV